MNTENQPNPAASQTANLAPVYLDNKPIILKDPKPKVSAILSAVGKPETTDVKWLQFQPNTQGKPLRSEEVLDRTTDPTKPIYLTSTSKGGQGGQATATAPAPAWKAKEGAPAPSAGQGFEVPKIVRPMGAKGEHAGATDEDADDSGMQHDADVGGESGRTATSDE